jgi:hypothetical protein
VHEVDPGLCTFEGVHTRDDREAVVVCAIVTVELPPDVGIGSPAADDETAFETRTVDDELLAPLATVRLAIATVPFATVVLFMPYTMHVYCPLAGLVQSSDFPALLAAGSAVTLTALKTAGE